jgi:hypothetical protein
MCVGYVADCQCAACLATDRELRERAGKAFAKIVTLGRCAFDGRRSAVKGKRRTAFHVRSEAENARRVRAVR